MCFTGNTRSKVIRPIGVPSEIVHGPCGNRGDFNLAADRGKTIEVVTHGSGHIDLKANARVAIAVVRILDAHVHSIARAQVLDLHPVAIAPFLEPSDDDGITVIAGHNDVA